MADRKYNFGFAGENFEFTVPGIGEDGQEETQSVLADYFPELKLTFGAKGTRGGRLGRSSTQVTKEVKFGPGGAPAGTNVNVINTPVSTNTGGTTVQNKPDESVKQEKAQRLLSSFIGPKGEQGIIGAEAVGAAKQYGYSGDQIKSMAQAESLKFGPTAAESLDLGNLSSYTGPDSTPGALGMTAVENARKSGLSDQAIRELAQRQGLKFGEQAANALNVSTAERFQTMAPAAPAPAPQAWSGSAASNYNPGGSLNQYVGSGGTAGAMGATAVQAAMNAGLSAEQIRSQAAQQGITFGPAALAMLR